MIDQIFNSVTDFHTAFINGLDKILSQEDLKPASFNLVFGNAILHHHEREFLERLESAKVRLSQKIDPNATDDDSLIFLKLKDMQLDWQNWTMIEDRKINSWNVQLNKFRILKPQGYNDQTITDLHVPFDDSKFNFNKIPDPPLWNGDLNGHHVSLFYNKFPYKDLQAVFVPDSEKNIEQLLTEEYHRFVFDLTTSLSNLRNISFGYNSLGAAASVNHLHFHMMVGIEKLPVTDPEWVHNGGSKPYPATIHVFDNIKDSWSLIDRLNQQNIAHNVLYLPGKIYVFPRKFIGTYIQAPWSTNFGWIQFSGNFIVYDEDAVTRLTEEIINDALEDASIKLEEQTSMSKYVTVARLEDIKEGKPHCVEVEGKSLSVFKVGDNFYVTTGICTHAGGPICLGEIINGVVTCPWHGSQFEVSTGKVVRGPAESPLKIYKTRVNDAFLEADLV